eukprot:s705_g11.t1
MAPAIFARWNYTLIRFFIHDQPVLEDDQDHALAAKLAARYAAAASLAYRSHRHNDIEAVLGPTSAIRRAFEGGSKAPATVLSQSERSTTPSAAAREAMTAARAARRLSERAPSTRLQLRLGTESRLRCIWAQDALSSISQLQAFLCFKKTNLMASIWGVRAHPAGFLLSSAAFRYRFRADLPSIRAMALRPPPSRSKPVPESTIDANGHYRTGRMGQTRKEAHEKLFRQRPSVEERVMKGPGAWKWKEKGRLDFDDVIGDGFCARYSKEFLVFNKKEDKVLAEFLEDLKAKCKRKSDQKDMVRLVAKEVSMAFGGLDPKVASTWQKRIDVLALPVGDSLHIGKLMRQPGVRFTGAGMCRHRTLLFKYLMDELKVADCAALTGVIVPPDVTNVAKFRRENGFADHAWNIVIINGTNNLLDIMNTPTELRTLNDKGELQLKAGHTSYRYYRIEGGAGISLAAPRGDAYEPSTDDDDYASLPEEEMDACCNFAAAVPSWSVDEVYCRSSGTLEPVLYCEPREPGRYLVEFEVEIGGKCWRARKRTSTSSRMGSGRKQDARALNSQD